MRLLVQCPHCKRQYNAGRRGVGNRFRCHCGRLLEIQQPQGHDARAVRCSACGAPRTENSDACPYCQAEFTLHERDLNTVCPNCLARVSDGARFCHHCGIGLVPELDASEDTEVLCPSCPGKHCLVSRRLGVEQVTVLECGRCGGFWLGHKAFRQLVERALHEVLPFGTHEALAPGSAGKGLEQHRRGRFYRPCVVCGQLMNRFNYGRVSGVIIDACKGHGIWFEAGALNRILDWVHLGGAELTAREEEYLRQQQVRRAERLQEHEKARWGDIPVQPAPHHDFLHSLLQPLLAHLEH